MHTSTSESLQLATLKACIVMLLRRPQLVQRLPHEMNGTGACVSLSACYMSQTVKWIQFCSVLVQNNVLSTQEVSSWLICFFNPSIPKFILF
jgi:hypothetical protein